MRTTAVIVFALAALSVSESSVARDEPAMAPMLVTDPSELVQAGFPPAATNVYVTANGSYFRITTDGSDRNGEAAPKSFGSSDTNTYTVSAVEFRPRHSDQKYTTTPVAPGGEFYFYCNTPATAEEFQAPVHLPSGALIVGFEYLGADSSDAAGDHNDAALVKVCQSANDTVNPVASDIAGPLGSSAPTSLAGSNFFAESGTLTGTDAERTVNNRQCFYFVEVNLGDSGCIGEQLRAYKARVLWKRQIAPAPGSATFGDVPTDHMFFQHIEALAGSGITVGCGNGNYCPGQAVTRGQMAAFLARALGLHWADQ